MCVCVCSATGWVDGWKWNKSWVAVAQREGGKDGGWEEREREGGRECARIVPNAKLRLVASDVSVLERRRRRKG